MALSPSKQLWQEALADLITDPKELFALLELDPALADSAYGAIHSFPLKATHSFVRRMKKGDIHDPLLKQVLPLGIELDVIPGYSSDPLQEAQVNPIPGLLHKYHGRVLVTLTSACAVHCRYCFRREFPYADNNPGRQGWERIFSYISEDQTINEVILSGGDPLSVSDSLLKIFSDQLNQIPHVKTLRIHTRLPIVLPERVTEGLIDWLKQLKQQPVMVIHSNHPNELSSDVVMSLKKIRHAGVQLMNQSVLLKGVNDDADTLVKLSQALFDAHVMPYYLHVLDKIHGAAHFDLPLERAKALHAEMTTQLPGYLVPRLACETPGEAAKTIL